MHIIDKNLKFGDLSNRTWTSKIVYHHADWDNCTVEDIHRSHVNRGWSGIGYHFFVRKDGSIYQGRVLTAIGAHTLGQNSDSIGICFEGKFTVEQPTEAQLNSAKELRSYLRSIYGDIREYGHKDFMSTDCPGSFYNHIGSLSSSAPVKQEVQAPTQKATWQNYIDGDIIKRFQHELNVQFNRGLDEDSFFGDLSIKATHGITVSRGAFGNITGIIQERLKALGYYKGKVDNDFGGLTEAAVGQFQKDRGLTADKIVGTNTFSELFKK
ncbi:MAG: hypothetical protein K0S61_701 [Anaerocolumna sp.]|jgi:hypothetical protein|nr:hypothetical protein [Anaerocolumna sp.]